MILYFLYLNSEKVKKMAKPSFSSEVNSSSVLLLIFYMLRRLEACFFSNCATNPKLLCHKVLLYNLLCLVDVVFLLFLARWVC